MRTYDLIHTKRDGGALSDSDIRAFIAAYTRDEIPDYQAAALAMAIFFRGLDARELATWTDAMLHSGDVLDLSSIPGIKVDKHSTGGVGDKISIPLAPLVAACGVKVPMVSGRGLGHTGGTLDKLESIPGFRVDLSVDRFTELVRDLGLALVGQTERLAPADRRLYALRDATATVESIPLIASSIMSKKLAEGIDALVLDVKVGAGAFMKTIDQARALARTLCDIGHHAGKPCVALLTDMDQPLGRAIGNANEIAESIDVLRGQGPADVTALTLALGAEMLLLAKIAKTEQDADARMKAAISNGSALDKFRSLIEAQGGDPRIVDDPSRLPQPRSTQVVPAPRSGFVTTLNAEAVGHAAMQLGAGRARKEDRIDPAAGVILRAKVGDRVQAGEALCLVQSNLPNTPAVAISLLEGAYSIADEPPPVRPLVLERIGTR